MTTQQSLCFTQHGQKMQAIFLCFQLASLIEGNHNQNRLAHVPLLTSQNWSPFNQSLPIDLETPQSPVELQTLPHRPPHAFGDPPPTLTHRSGGLTTSCGPPAAQSIAAQCDGAFSATTLHRRHMCCVWHRTRNTLQSHTLAAIWGQRVTHEG